VEVALARSLGKALHTARKLRGLSLARAAKPADISPAYLDKLEQDKVHAPSPHILHQLADVLGVNYDDLMRLAGYVVSSPGSVDSGQSALASALASDLTDDEIVELTKYLAWYRSQQRNG
jgi:transcriptional regulator with XRE-family HTH domain